MTRYFILRMTVSGRFHASYHRDETIAHKQWQKIKDCNEYIWAMLVIWDCQNMRATTEYFEVGL